MSHEPGILISFEGSEGCGKSTQIRRLADRLEEIDHREVVVTREPGGTVIGEDIRHLLMHADSSKNIFPETELLLFADRAQLGKLSTLSVQMENCTLRPLRLDHCVPGVARQIADDPVVKLILCSGGCGSRLDRYLRCPCRGWSRKNKTPVSDMPDRMNRKC